MRRIFVVVAIVCALLPRAAFVQDRPRQTVIAEETSVDRGGMWERCADVGAGTLYVRVADLRVPVPDSFRVDLYRVDGAYAVPLLVVRSSPDQTFSVHRIEAGTYCLRANLSMQPRGNETSLPPSMGYGVIRMQLDYEPA